MEKEPPNGAGVGGGVVVGKVGGTFFGRNWRHSQAWRDRGRKGVNVPG